MTRAWLSLGSNIEPARHLADALDELRAHFGSITESPWYRAVAVGFDGPDFINLAASLETELPAAELDAWLHSLEARHGRDRTQPRFSSRTLDIDIVLYGESVIAEPGGLHIPRDDLKHAFVLRPLCDIAPDLVPPDGDARTLAERWSRMAPAERDSVQRIARDEAE
jgi:2-amino-4-hydroxy-6-hydroxymethyldihydropteridine diphosphokinase